MSAFRIDDQGGAAPHERRWPLLPLPVPGTTQPTLRFRLRAWREFERALDPLGRARPLPPALREGPGEWES